MVDWYDRRSELQPGMVFRCYDGDVIQLDRRVPGDGSQWYVADWSNGWSFVDGTIEPGDLIEELPRDYAGEPPTPAF